MKQDLTLDLRRRKKRTIGNCISVGSRKLKFTSSERCCCWRLPQILSHRSPMEYDSRTNFRRQAQVLSSNLRRPKGTTKSKSPLPTTAFQLLHWQHQVPQQPVRSKWLALKIWLLLIRLLLCTGNAPYRHRRLRCV